MLSAQSTVAITKAFAYKNVLGIQVAYLLAITRQLRARTLALALRIVPMAVMVVLHLFAAATTMKPIPITFYAQNFMKQCTINVYSTVPLAILFVFLRVSGNLRRI